jgi:hypothetical protein
MKRLGMLLVLVSVSMFVFGCAETKKKGEAPKGGATVEKKEGGAAAPPAAPEKKEEKH